ncbi:transposase [Streptomyces mirabilis]|uniref:transposase n=1 Tax=Streptomyces mirabilis TaxID=68239 RepID=UPI0036B52BF4
MVLVDHFCSLRRRITGEPRAWSTIRRCCWTSTGCPSYTLSGLHCGLTGDVRNCQTMVMLTYAIAAGHAFIDRRLYLPEEWTEDRERCRAAGIPDEVGFATKPELAIAMLDGALAAGVPSPGYWPIPATDAIRRCGPGAMTGPCPTCSASPSTSRWTAPAGKIPPTGGAARR